MIPTKFPCRMLSRNSGRTIVVTELTDDEVWGPNTGTGYYDPPLPAGFIKDILESAPSYLGDEVYNDFSLDNFEEIKEN